MKHTKFIISGILTALLFFGSNAFASNTNKVTVVLDGEVLNFDVPAQIIDERTMVPMRAIFEKLGATVEWDGETRTVTAHKKGIVISMTIGNTSITRNNVPQNIDVPAQIVDDRTLVPVRFVSEYMGSTVDWNQETKTVTITSNNTIQYIDWNDNYEYYGEVANGYANGYGILYSKSDGSISQLGQYRNSIIVTGGDLYSDGSIYVGNYKNGDWSYGSYYEATTGNGYTGDFQGGKRHGTGTFLWADGSFYDGKWEDDLPNGYGILYDAVENIQYKGNFTDGKREGSFTIEDFNINKTYHANYDDDVYMDSNYYINKYNEEYEDLIVWVEEETEKIYEEGEAVYNQYINDQLKSLGINSSNGWDGSGVVRSEAMIWITPYAEKAKNNYIAEALESLYEYVEKKETELKEKYHIK